MAEKQCAICCETKSVSEFYLRTDGYRHSYCKPCCRGLARRRWLSDPQFRLRHQTPERQAYYRKWWRRGMTDEEFAAMRQAQDDGCAICGEADGLVLDHDHTTGANRGLLCGFCNRALGSFRDDPARLKAAIAYLRRWQG